MLHLCKRGTYVLRVSGKLGRGDCCAGSTPHNLASQKLPFTEVWLGNKRVRGLLDTGCSNSIVKASLVGEPSGSSFVSDFSGKLVECGGSVLVELKINGKLLNVKMIAADELLKGVDIVIGWDVIKEVWPNLFDQPCAGVATKSLSGNGVKVADVIEDKDFSAKFHGSVWTVEWKWKSSSPPVLRNKVEEYSVSIDEEKKAEYEAEVQRWIDEKILIPWNEEVEGVLPLMAVVQATKNKVRPVLDFRELNQFVECHTGDDEINICSEKMREWRKTNGELELVDLQSAYLQIRVAPHLWKHQIVMFKGKTYCLTRLGFGLNVAPRIMAVVLKNVLNKNEKVMKATSSYIDDILVNVSEIESSEVINHLAKFGLKCKPAEKLDGGAALGLRLEKTSDGSLSFKRGNIVPEIPDELTRRELFSTCGKMVGHYPIANWLRVACSFVKRIADGRSWDDPVGDKCLKVLREIRERLRTEDPVKGDWTVPNSSRGTVWCDASSLAVAAILEVEGVEVEDRAWLRKNNDYGHINIVELDAVDWKVAELLIKTDSSTVCSWIKLILSEDHPVRTKGAAEVLIKRRLSILKSLVDELGLKVSVELVASEHNKADSLTRVPKSWLGGATESCCVSVVEDLHGRSHLGVDRTLFLAKKVDPSVSREQVKKVVRRCEECQSIDPAPVRHDAGELQVEKNWSRLAVDVTHYRGIPYLTMVDCGPGRFALWRELKRESAWCVCVELQSVFWERGPVEEVVMDNGKCFRSSELRALFEHWNINTFFRAAYRPSGNSIVERNHRTIKSWAEKAGVEPNEAVFWYNVSPRRGQEDESVPQKAVYTYSWRLPMEIPDLNEREKVSNISVGDQVWVKPGHARCTTKWGRGVVTEVNSSNNVSIDGMPRHILDVRRVVPADEYECVGVEEEGGSAEQPQPRRSGRVRRPPQWLADYVPQ